MSEPKLKPCPNPWCDHEEPKLIDYDGKENAWYYECSGCAITPEGFSATSELAADAWNKRPEPEPSEHDIKLMEALTDKIPLPGGVLSIPGIPRASGINDESGDTVLNEMVRLTREVQEAKATLRDELEKAALTGILTGVMYDLAKGEPTVPWETVAQMVVDCTDAMLAERTKPQPPNNNP